MRYQDSNGSSALAEPQIAPANGRSANDEEDRLCELEEIMEQNLGEVSGIEWRTAEAKDCCARALREIHDKGLFEKTHKNFASYLNERWNLSRSYGYELVQYIKEKDDSAIAEKPTSPGQAKARRKATKALTQNPVQETKRAPQKKAEEKKEPEPKPSESKSGPEAPDQPSPRDPELRTGVINALCAPPLLIPKREATRLVDSLSLVNPKHSFHWQ